MFKFLPGILLIQFATSALVFILLRTTVENFQAIAVAIISLVISLFGAFWFASIAQNTHKDALEKTRQAHAQEREDLLVDTERQKVDMLKQTHAQIVKETNRAHAKANLKVGAMFTAAVGVGAVMVFAQFITVGLIMLATTGGALTGYLARARQDRLAKITLQKQINVPQQTMLRLEKPTK
jgi:flagellar biosynthesis protein FliP